MLQGFFRLLLIVEPESRLHNIFNKFLGSEHRIINFPLTIGKRTRYRIGPRNIGAIIIKLSTNINNNEIPFFELRIITGIMKNSTIFADESAESALAQIETKKYHQKYLQQGKKITLIGVQFNTEKRNLEKWLIKELT